MGWWITFNVGDDAALRAERAKVLQAFFDQGGTVIDSSPMYGSSEEVIGYCLERTTAERPPFAATKVWTPFRWPGIRQMKRSEELWGTNRFDPLQLSSDERRVGRACVNRCRHRGSPFNKK